MDQTAPAPSVPLPALAGENRRPGANDFTPELGEEICRLIGEEGFTLGRLERVQGFPYKRTVLRWLDKHPEFAEEFRRAREACAEVMAAECLEIADDSSNDEIEVVGKDGKTTYTRTNHENINRSRLRVETRKWMMGMWSQKYRESVAITGAEGGPLVITRVERVMVSPGDKFVPGAKVIEGEVLEAAKSPVPAS